MTTGTLRITGLDVFVAGTSWRNLTLVRVSTDDGITGWGEATVEYREHAVAAHIEFLEHIVRGADALAPAAIWKRVVEDDWFQTDPVCLSAASGIITACLDIAGKAYGVPVHRLLGGAVRERIRVYANGWYQGERTPASFAELARTVRDRGHRALKVDPFGAAGIEAARREVEEGVEIVAAIRKAVGPEIDIYVDAHGRFTPASARLAAELLADHRIGYLEEPVGPQNLHAMRELRSISPVPIAAGERCLGRLGFSSLIENDCVDIIQPDVCWSGGLLETQRIAAWAEVHGMLVSLHNANSPLATMLGCHFGAVTPNFVVLETFDDFDEAWVRSAFPGWPQVEDGSLPLPQKPGIGIEPDESVLLEHPHRPVFMNLHEPGWERREAVLGAPEQAELRSS